MSYNYDTLEQALEQAAYRLPVRTVGSLISRAEDIITTNSDSQELEREIQDLLGGNNVFSLKKLDRQGQGSPAAAAA